MDQWGEAERVRGRTDERDQVQGATRLPHVSSFPASRLPLPATHCFPFPSFSLPAGRLFTASSSPRAAALCFPLAASLLLPSTGPPPA
ncbi:hypothetical protein CLOM_g18569 [Closterium sp. NIES-68]|nr:hypothetical protein CLOM_g18569 [Closterium sp. NIES-68]GJP82251.1 hypothetical protein CLOP_g12486 [Closterium sp. NIES-67]